MYSDATLGLALDQVNVFTHICTFSMSGSFMVLSGRARMLVLLNLPLDLDTVAL